ncbi:hypothetical protein ACQWU4_02870 [Chryseobacterium sp. MIQD13]|uniref:hypothetical protein n=1 Tax=Chryseobacterium sp. MIQD13 TaxID=3422310 RepID=UPI003D2D854C
MIIPEKLKAILSNSYIRVLMLLIPFYCFEGFLLKPFIREHYLKTDLDAFKIDSWKYIFMITAVIAIVIIILSKAKKISQIIIVIILSTILTFSLKSLISNILLFINYHTEISQTVQTYEIISHKKAMVFWLNAGKNNSIYEDGEIHLIDKKRKTKDLKSIFEYKTGDTVKVKLKKGIFNVNYLN